MKKFVPITIFAIAMGFLEAAVVVYLRELYYPAGFSFPLNPNIPYRILIVEIIREITTLIMLFCVGLIAGKNFITKICYFLFCFGVWDIFYYVGLKMFLDWPESLLTWDLLFLIPLPWVGPVVAPIICSLTMIFLGVSVVYIEKKTNVLLKGKFFDWMLAVVGAFIIYLTFTWDFTNIVISEGFIKKFPSLATNSEFAKIISFYKPKNFLWIPFVIGEMLIFISFLKVYYENRRNK